MTASKSKSGFFFGWWTVLASGVSNMWTSGYTVYGISVFFKPIASELGTSRAVTSAVSSIGRLDSGFEGPVAGWAVDKIGPRKVVIFGVLVTALGLVLMNYVDSLITFFVVWGIVVASGGNLITGVPLDVAISNWFVKKRGVAMSLKWVLAGLSGVIILPLIAWLMVAQGWRMTCFIGGVVLAIVGVPISFVFLKDHRPEWYGWMPDGASMEEAAVSREQMIEAGMRYAEKYAEEVEFTARQALRTSTYWGLMLVQAIFGLVSPVMTIHLIPFLTDIGIDPLVAAGTESIMVGISIPFRFVGGFIADRIKTNRLRFLQGVAYFFQASGVAVFLLNQNMTNIYVWFVLYGVGQGITYIINPLIMARYFGRKALGSIRGVGGLIMTPVGIVAPILVGWVYDTAGNYISAFTMLAILLAIAGVVACFILPTKRPAHISDSGQIL